MNKSEPNDYTKEIMQISHLKHGGNVYSNAKNNVKKNSKIGLLATEATIKTGIYNHYFNKKFLLILLKKNPDNIKDVIDKDNN